MFLLLGFSYSVAKETALVALIAEAKYMLGGSEGSSR